MAKDTTGGGGGPTPRDTANNSSTGASSAQKAALPAKVSKSKTGTGPGLNRDQIEALVGRMIDSAKAIQAAEWRAFEARVDAQLKNLDVLKLYPTTNKTLAITVGAVVVGIGAFLAILAFGGDRFDGGIGYGTVASDKFSQATIAIDRNAQRDEELRRSVEQLVKKMDRLIDDDAKTK